jgi:hypothetical protein
MLGLSVLRPKQWWVPLSQNSAEVTQVTLSNKTARKFIQGIAGLIEYFFNGAEEIMA